MDVLSRDMLSLLRDEGLRKAVKDLVRDPAGTTKDVEVTVPRDDTRRGGHDGTKVRTIRLRRLAL